jgi:serine/threonine protein kinase
LDREAYQAELRALEKSCAQIQREKHLIKLLLTFQHGDKYYLLFEWADGNLEEFWERHPAGPTELMGSSWAAEQFCGIASAVKRIHGLSTWQKKKRNQLSGDVNDSREWGRHGDIKPDNILWFSTHGEDRNLLVLSDLGLTRYHTQISRSKVRHSHVEGYTRVYRPPEMDLDTKVISQKYDIWSLGCVYLEFCIWYLKGFKAVRQFEYERAEEDRSDIQNYEEAKFFNIIKHDNRNFAEVKPTIGKVRTRVFGKCHLGVYRYRYK